MLENKLGLTSSAELAREEERISKKKAAMLFENHILDNLESGKFSILQTIHKYLFDEIYDFAGKLRTVNIANYLHERKKYEHKNNGQQILFLLSDLFFIHIYSYFLFLINQYIKPSATRKPPRTQRKMILSVPSNIG